MKEGAPLLGVINGADTNGDILFLRHPILPARIGAEAPLWLPWLTTLRPLARADLVRLPRAVGPDCFEDYWQAHRVPQPGG
jgi:hypothetical protein